MGLVLDSSTLIGAEREARPVSQLLRSIEQDLGETEILISSISVIELEHGLYRAVTAKQFQRRKD
jgi:predicted nucleic acid-binding protein